MDELKKSDLPPGCSYLILCDNLGGQTKKTNPKFAALLLKWCNAVVWNLLAGCTDEIQVVDAGFGALTKRKTEEVQQEWLQDDENWAEWTGANLSASRRRVLMTHWYGEGYERACLAYDFCKVFNRTGSKLTADGSGDDVIKLQGLDSFSFSTEDAKRNPLTGEFDADQNDVPAVEAAIEADDTAADAAEQKEAEELSQNEGSDSGSGGETDGDGEPFECPDEWTVLEDCPDLQTTAHKTLAHRWEEGWFIGKINRKVELSTNRAQNGKYACKYPDSRKEFFHDLFSEDYGIEHMWVILTPASDS